MIGSRAALEYHAAVGSEPHREAFFREALQLRRVACHGKEDVKEAGGGGMRVAPYELTQLLGSGCSRILDGCLIRLPYPATLSCYLILLPHPAAASCCRILLRHPPTSSADVILCLFPSHSPPGTQRRHVAHLHRPRVAALPHTSA